MSLSPFSCIQDALTKNVNIDKFKTDIIFVQHSSAKRIVTSYFLQEYPSVAEDQILDHKTEFTVFLNAPVVEATVRDIIKVVRKTGYWGYHKRLAKRKREIHYWVNKRREFDIGEMLYLFTHELAHAAGYSEEDDAVKIGGIACFAYENIVTDFLKIKS